MSFILKRINKVTIRLKVATSVVIVMVLCNIGEAQSWELVNEKGFETPSMEGAQKGRKTFHVDFSYTINGNETELEVYRRPDGSFFNTLKYKGKLYGYIVDTDGKEPFEYTLIDTDGDGTFDLKTDRNDLDIPKWAN